MQLWYRIETGNFINKVSKRDDDEKKESIKHLFKIFNIKKLNTDSHSIFFYCIVKN